MKHRPEVLVRLESALQDPGAGDDELACPGGLLGVSIVCVRAYEASGVYLIPENCRSVQSFQ